MEKPLVSIICNTYNHEEYIQDAIEGFLLQKTDFDYEILIHDDASTDRTPEIIKKYEERYPEIIRVIYEKENQHSKGLHITEDIMFCLCKGKYAALCEGDDFWLDSNKLQIQVDYMEKHADCVMTTHGAVVFDCEKGKIGGALLPYDCEKDLSAEELIMWYHGNVPTASLLLRLETVWNEKIYLNNMPSGDWALQLYCITKGKVHYSDRIMACYRANAIGSYTKTQWGNLEKRIGIRISQIHFLCLYNQYTHVKYSKFIEWKILENVETVVDELRDITDSYSQAEKLLDHILERMEYGTKDIIEQIKEIIRQKEDCTFCREIIKNFVKKYNHIYIMGAASVAQKLSAQMEYNHLNFDGYLVSPGQNHPEEIGGKKVWQLDNYPYAGTDTGIIIAVGYYFYKDVSEALDGYQITQRIHPFMLQGWKEKQQ